MPRPCPLSPNQIDEACRLYSAGVSQHELARRFDVHRSLVLRVLRRRGVAVRTIREICSPPLRDDAFDSAETDEAAAYWVGFLMADGCVSHYHSRPAIIVQLHESDADHTPQPLLQLVGSNPLMTQFTAFANALTHSSVPPHRSHGCWGAAYHSGAAALLVSELYTDCTVALPRKWATAHEMLCGWATRPRVRGVCRF